MQEPTDPAQVLADMPLVVAALLAEHVADDRGRCRACGNPGTGAPYMTAPCSLRTVAERARQIAVQRDAR